MAERLRYQPFPDQRLPTRPWGWSIWRARLTHLRLLIEYVASAGAWWQPAAALTCCTAVTSACSIRREHWATRWWCASTLTPRCAEPRVRAVPWYLRRTALRC